MLLDNERMGESPYVCLRALYGWSLVISNGITNSRLLLISQNAFRWAKKRFEERARAISG